MSAYEPETTYRIVFEEGYLEEVNVSSAQITGLDLNRSCFTEKPTVGQANAAEVETSFLIPEATIPRAASFKVYATQNGVERLYGSFILDTREVDRVSGTMTIHGYDSMVGAGMVPYPRAGQKWPDNIVLTYIAAAMGWTLDSSVLTAITHQYYIWPKFSTGASCREMLQYIAQAYAGAFYLDTDGTTLMFTRLTLPEESNLLVDRSGNVLTFGGVGIELNAEQASPSPVYEIGEEPINLKAESVTAGKAWSVQGVRIISDKDQQTAGDLTDEAKVMTIEIPWAYGHQNDSMANNLLAVLSGTVYRPFEATNVLIPFDIKMGQPVIIGDVYGRLCSMHIAYGPLLAADISAPSSGDIDHEYAADAVQKKISATTGNFSTVSSDTLMLGETTLDEDQLKQLLRLI